MNPAKLTPATLLVFLSLGAFSTALLAQAPVNDHFADAITLPGTENGSITGSNRNATTELNEPAILNEYSGKSVWWKWTAPADGRFVLHTAGSSFDTMLVVFTGTSLDDLTLVDWSDDSMGGRQSRLSFPAAAGVTYHIVVDGYGPRGFGSIKLAWMHQPTMVYTWRDQFTTEGAEAVYDEFDELEGYDWYPKATFVENGLIVRGRSTSATLPAYGQELGPIAKFTFHPVRVGRKTVRYFTIKVSKPTVIPPDDPGDTEQVFGGFYSSLTLYKRSPATTHEGVMGEYYSLDEDDNLQFDGGFYVEGKAALKSPFTGAAKTWFASRLANDFSYASPIDTGDLPDQGEPEYGTFNRVKQTLLFSSSFTNRVKHLDFDAAVAAIRQHLLDNGGVEGEPP